MKWTERHHAFLIGLFYREMVDQWGSEGEAFFAQATREYAEQRGYRMAKRAQKHGFALDFSAYFSHGEWAPTEPPTLKGQSFSDGLDWVILNPECPWLSTFQAMGEPACARAYCALIDKYLLKGFNPALALEVETFLQDSDYCTFRWKDADLSEEDWVKIAQVKSQYTHENVMSFAYHICHVWKSFKLVLEREMGEESGLVLDRVKERFQDKYGVEALAQMIACEAMDFNLLPEENQEKKCYENETGRLE